MRRKQLNKRSELSFFQKGDNAERVRIVDMIPDDEPPAPRQCGRTWKGGFVYDNVNAL